MLCVRVCVCVRARMYVVVLPQLHYYIVARYILLTSHFECDDVLLLFEAVDTRDPAVDGLLVSDLLCEWVSEQESAVDGRGSVADLSVPVVDLCDSSVGGRDPSVVERELLVGGRDPDPVAVDLRDTGRDSVWLALSVP